jgi:hypothetical protein
VTLIFIEPKYTIKIMSINPKYRHIPTKAINTTDKYNNIIKLRYYTMFTIHQNGSGWFTPSNIQNAKVDANPNKHTTIAYIVNACHCMALLPIPINHKPTKTINITDKDTSRRVSCLFHALNCTTSSFKLTNSLCNGGSNSFSWGHVSLSNQWKNRHFPAF